MQVEHQAIRDSKNTLSRQSGTGNRRLRREIASLAFYFNRKSDLSASESKLAGYTGYSSQSIVFRLFMTLQLESLRKAVHALREVSGKSRDTEFMAQLDEIARQAVRAGVIQHFEFTYELCWKMIKRWLDLHVSPFTGEGASRRQLFRLAAEYGLIDDVERWMRFHEARNETSHVYNLATAEKVYNIACAFVQDAEMLLNNLEKRRD